jgi:hypothetical protein
MVIAVPAEGAMTLQRMLYFFPSNPRVLVNAIMAALAVEYCTTLVRLLDVNMPDTLRLSVRSFHLK